MAPVGPQSLTPALAGRPARPRVATWVEVALGILLTAPLAGCSRSAANSQPAAESAASSPATVLASETGAATLQSELTTPASIELVQQPSLQSPALDIASGPGLRAAFGASVEACPSIEPWLQLAELALASLAADRPARSASGGWTYRVDWPHSDDRVEVTSTTDLPEDAHLVQIRVELARACQPAECPIALDGLLQIFLRWKQDALVECTVMTQLDVPQSAEVDDWIAQPSAANQGSRRKGAFIQCYSNAPAVRRTIELRLERTPDGPVRESRFVDAPPCECSTQVATHDVLRNLCRAVRQSHR